MLQVVPCKIRIPAFIQLVNNLPQKQNGIMRTPEDNELKKFMTSVYQELLAERGIWES
jgi:hypothetical protein